MYKKGSQSGEKGGREGQGREKASSERWNVKRTGSRNHSLPGHLHSLLSTFPSSFFSSGIILRDMALGHSLSRKWRSTSSAIWVTGPGGLKVRQLSEEIEASKASQLC